MPMSSPMPMSRSAFARPSEPGLLRRAQVLHALRQIREVEQTVGTLRGDSDLRGNTSDRSGMSASQLADIIRQCEASYAQLSETLKQMDAQHVVASSTAQTPVALQL